MSTQPETLVFEDFNSYPIEVQEMIVRGLGKAVRGRISSGETEVNPLVRTLQQEATWTISALVNGAEPFKQ